MGRVTRVLHDLKKEACLQMLNLKFNDNGAIWQASGAASMMIYIFDGVMTAKLIMHLNEHFQSLFNLV